MGFENRDYARGGSYEYGGSGSYRGGYSSGMPPACKWILILTIAVFVIQLVWTARPSDAQVERFREQLYNRVGVAPEESHPVLERQVRLYSQTRESVVQQWFELAPEKVFPGFQLWRLVTYAFCHSRGEVFHIVFNMLALWFFAPTLERMYGTREFAWFYLMGAAASGLAFIALEVFLGQMSPVIGASGAVMAVLMLYAAHYPRQIIRIWGIIPIEVRWIVGIFIVVDLYPVLKSLGGDRENDNVAHAAHLGGLLFGYLYFKFQWRFERLFSGFRLPDVSRHRPKSRGDLRLYEPPENLDERVDAILEKISQTGEASLTDQEREILKAASNRYKKRG